MEVVPGLHTLPGVGPGVNCFLWLPRPGSPGDEGPLLFDCGMPWSGAGLVASLAELGCKPVDIRGIAITHDDIDHAGRLASLQAVSGAAVIAHRWEGYRLARDRWREPQHLAGPLRLAGWALEHLSSHWPHHPVRVDRPVDDGEAVGGGWIAVHTPGHTPGHASYWHPSSGVLVAGDALGRHRNGRLRSPMALFTEDSDEAARSIRKLAGLDPEVIVFGHGPALYHAGSTLRQFASGL